MVKRSIGPHLVLHCLGYRARENVSIAKAADVRNTVLVDQYICLSRRAAGRERCDMSICDGCKAYRSQVPVDNPRIMHAIQTLGQCRQLLSRGVRDRCLL